MEACVESRSGLAPARLSSYLLSLMDVAMDRSETAETPDARCGDAISELARLSMDVLLPAGH